jgi:crotonobetainyl-CoA:carnitine CoA-transferase CaiB-like acyl-CoA transferase
VGDSYFASLNRGKRSVCLDYVPAQLFPTAEGHLALFVTHDGFWRAFAAEAGVEGFPTMAERAARRDEVLAAVREALAADTATGWESRLRPLGVLAAAVRTLPEALAATPQMIVTVGSAVRVAGYEPAYGPPPRLGEHGPGPAGAMAGSGN